MTPLKKQQRKTRTVMRNYSNLPNCDRCGRFHRCDPGSSYAMRYSGFPPTPDHEQTRCVKCTKAHGPLTASSGISEWTAGVVTVDEIATKARELGYKFGKAKP